MLFSARTRIYTVYLKPTDRKVAETAEFVEDGFSFPAFLFSWVWALYQRLWLVAIAQIAFLILLPKLVQMGALTAAASVAAQIAVQLLFGLEAANLRHRSLLKRGYVLSDVVAEDSLLHARQRYYARHASVLA